MGEEDIAVESDFSHFSFESPLWQCSASQQLTEERLRDDRSDDTSVEELLEVPPVLDPYFDIVSLHHTKMEGARRRTNPSKSIQHWLIYRPRSYVCNSSDEPCLNSCPMMANRSDPSAGSEDAGPGENLALSRGPCSYYIKLLRWFGDVWIDPSPIGCSSDTSAPLFGCKSHTVSAIAIKPFGVRARIVFSEALKRHLSSGGSKCGDFLGLPRTSNLRLLAYSDGAPMPRLWERSRLSHRAQNEQLTALSTYSHSSKKPPPVLLFFGGKDQLALDWLPFISSLLKGMISTPAQEAFDPKSIECRINTLMIVLENPGYGFSRGYPSPETSMSEAINILQRCSHEYGAKKLSVNIVTYSIGASSGLKTSDWILNHTAQFSLATMCLIAPPTSIVDCTMHLLRVPTMLYSVASSMIKRFEDESTSWNNLDLLRQVFMTANSAGEEATRYLRVSIFHGGADSIVPCCMNDEFRCVATSCIEFSEQLMHLRERIQCRVIPGATHRTIFEARFSQPLIDATIMPGFVDWLQSEQLRVRAMRRGLSSGKQAFSD